jgi:hypothetical protein
MSFVICDKKCGFTLTISATGFNFLRAFYATYWFELKSGTDYKIPE